MQVGCSNNRVLNQAHRQLITPGDPNAWCAEWRAAEHAAERHHVPGPRPLDGNQRELSTPLLLMAKHRDNKKYDHATITN